MTREPRLASSQKSILRSKRDYMEAVLSSIEAGHVKVTDYGL
jgi:hypothetical protein